MEQEYRQIKFRQATLDLIGKFNTAISELQDQGIRKMTLRQLYYEMVRRNYIPNTKKMYRQMATILCDARYAGLVDWDAIEDLEREPTEWQEYESALDAVETVTRNFRLERWKGQEHYVEMWVEKKAMMNTFNDLAYEFHVPLQPNKGYSSASSLRVAANRINRACRKYVDGDVEEMGAIVFYMGDHDPSGNHMVVDIRNRLREFECDAEVRKLALTIQQVRQFKLPPNPAQIRDPRARDYIREFGRVSWEVEALQPRQLHDIVRREFRKVIDVDKMNAIKEREETIVERLEKVASELSDENEE